MEINKLLTKRNYTEMNNPNRVKFIVIHYVGALSGAENNCHYFYSEYRGASAHYFVGYQGEIWQCVDDADSAWHCGVSGSVSDKDCNNQNSIGIEMCVRKKSTSTMYATDKDWYFEDATVDSAVELTKALMKKYNVPAENVIRHYDVTGKICPNPYVYNTTNHTWAEFKERISDKTTTTTSTPTTTPTTKTVYYRVRKSWADSKSQIGAYTKLDGAKEACDKAGAGYHVFDEAGKTLYSAKIAANVETVAYPAVKYGDSGSAVKTLQNLLTKHGYACGTIDGIFGTKTLNAVKSFQKAKGITTDGVVGEETWDALNAEFNPYLVAITASVLRVRKGPSTNYDVVTTVQKNGIYTIVDENNGWGLLKAYKSGRNGWICLDYTKKV